MYALAIFQHVCALRPKRAWVELFQEGWRDKRFSNLQHKLVSLEGFVFKLFIVITMSFLDLSGQGGVVSCDQHSFFQPKLLLNYFGLVGQKRDWWGKMESWWGSCPTNFTGNSAPENLSTSFILSFINFGKKAITPNKA